MTRRIRPLTTEDVQTLGATWSEVGWFVADPVTLRSLSPEALFDVKHRWFRDSSSLWGTCGLALPGLGEGENTLAGYVLFAPPGLTPGREVPPTAPASVDAVVLLELWVDPHQLNTPISKILVQSVAAELAHRGGVEALEAFATRAAPQREFPTEELLTGIGFHVKRDHPRLPRLRMELKGTRHWIADVEEAWEKLLAGVRGHKEPAAGNPAAGRLRGAQAPEKLTLR